MYPVDVCSVVNTVDVSSNVVVFCSVVDTSASFVVIGSAVVVSDFIIVVIVSSFVVVIIVVVVVLKTVDIKSFVVAECPGVMLCIREFDTPDVSS